MLQIRVTQDLLGKIVRTNNNHRTYEVTDVLFGKNPSSTYKESSNETIAGYYKRVRVMLSQS
jgi:hypothetical protein